MGTAFSCKEGSQVVGFIHTVGYNISKLASFCTSAVTVAANETLSN